MKNEKNGLVTEYYENGEKKEEGFYRDGQLEGLLTVWGEDGQMQYAENYKEGMLHGLLTMYSVIGVWLIIN